jgi:pyruvate/2-oxoglutarate dehydrogenase complex dihydrolipoamide acyltransferase (E2) component
VAPPDGGRYRRLSATPDGTTLSDQPSEAMPTPVVMPQQGLVEEMVVLEWLRADGEQVAAGEPIVLLETEKTQTEVEAPASGTLRVVVPAGPDVLPADTVLGEIE